MHPNAGALLRSEILILPLDLLNSGDQHVDHLSDTPDPVITNGSQIAGIGDHLVPETTSFLSADTKSARNFPTVADVSSLGPMHIANGSDSVSVHATMHEPSVSMLPEGQHLDNNQSEAALAPSTTPTHATGNDTIPAPPSAREIDLPGSFTTPASTPAPSTYPTTRLQHGIRKTKNLY